MRPLAVALPAISTRWVMRGTVPFEGPFALGHEFVGEVVEAGDEAGVAAGDRVIGHRSRCSCGECDALPGRAHGELQRGRRRARCTAFGGRRRRLGRRAGRPRARALRPRRCSSRFPTASSPRPWRSLVGQRGRRLAHGVGPQLAEQPGAPVLIVGGGAHSIALYAGQTSAWPLGAERVDFIDTDPEPAGAGRAARRRVRSRGRRRARPARYPITVNAGARPREPALRDPLHRARRDLHERGHLLRAGHPDAAVRDVHARHPLPHRPRELERGRSRRCSGARDRRPARPIGSRPAGWSRSTRRPRPWPIRPRKLHRRRHDGGDGALAPRGDPGRRGSEAFTERGFAGATIEDVRERSGASTGSIYHHFGGKGRGSPPRSTWRGCATTRSGFLRQLRRSREREGDGHGRWSATTCVAIARNAELARFIFHRHESEVRAQTKEPLAQLQPALLDRGGNAARARTSSPGALRRLPLDLFNSALIGPSQEFARHWLAGRTKTSIKQPPSASWPKRPGARCSGAKEAETGNDVRRGDRGARAPPTTSSWWWSARGRTRLVRMDDPDKPRTR